MESTVKEIDLSQYTGKSVNELLEAIGPYQEHIFFDNKPGRLDGVTFVYEGKSLDVYVEEYQNMKRFTLERDWDIDALKKEKIHRAEWR